jgi:hypothetical protein
MWFFGLLIVLSVVLVGLEYWFTLQRQLTPERLDRARHIWDAHWQGRPRDYVWEYAVEDRSRNKEVYRIEVRNGQAISAARQEDERFVPVDRYPYATMDALFDHVAELLEADRNSEGPRAYMTVDFDGRDGHVVRLIRSIRSTRERTEIDVKLEALPAGTPSS